jgi:hypothetical protein
MTSKGRTRGYPPPCFLKEIDSKGLTPPENTLRASVDPTGVAKEM